jgi:hypothetical protein
LWGTIFCALTHYAVATDGSGCTVVEETLIT